MSDEYLDKIVKEYKAKQASLIAARWAIGFNDRGMGHGDYGVITGKGDLIVACPSKEIAEHIVSLHNKDISDGKYSKGKKGKAKGKAGRRQSAPSNGKPRKRRATGG